MNPRRHSTDPYSLTHQTGSDVPSRNKVEAHLSHWLGMPAVAWLVLFFLFPLAIVLLVSFAVRGTYGGVIWSFSLENYLHLTEAPYLRIYARSCLLAALTTAICLVLGFPLAY